MTTADLTGFRANWRLMGRSPETAANYLRCVERLEIPLAEVTHADLLAHLAEMSERLTPNGMQLEVRSFRAFFAWYADFHDVPNPAIKLKTVRVPETPVRVVTEEEHQALLRQCGALDFRDARDRAALCVLWATGMRRSELARVELAHLDMAEQTITIPRTKNGKSRKVGLDSKAVRALQRYLKLRQKHKHARSPFLLLAERGALSSDGLRQAIQDRAKAAGCPGVSAHCYRRALATRWMAANGSESLLRAFCGWQSPHMVSRYVRGAAQELAIAQHRALLG